MNDINKKQNGRAFVVRPFNIKENRDGESVDFERVDRELISPVIKQLGLSGGTTGEFLLQGDIREDMFRELLTADLVIADISIHNANAFYELGIRHGMCDRITVIIKADKHADEAVFDLKPDRYFSYDPEDPAASIESLKKYTENSLKNDQVDSPVFRLLPGLERVRPENVVVVPRDFREKVGQQSSNAEGLLILVDEATGESWEKEGLRVVGEAQFKLNDHVNAVTTWERVRELSPYDIEANHKLATCYQKTSQYVLSEQAAERALINNANDWDRAETYALIGSNKKTLWRQQWQDDDLLADRQIKALVSDLLDKSYESYRLGYEQHRSHYYSGLNAVAMRSIQLTLARKHFETWALDFDSDEEAEFELKKVSKHLAKLIAATELAIDSSIRNYPNDEWALISAADILLLTSDQPERVKRKYQKCVHTIKDFTASSLVNQVELYQSLGLFEENVNAVLEIVGQS